MRMKVGMLFCASLLAVTLLTTAAESCEMTMAAAPTVESETKADLVSEFAKMLCWRKDRPSAEAFIEDDVTIPDIRENSRTGHIQVVPSTKKDVMILLVHFEDKVLKGERLAFIWEVAVKNDRITRIRVLYDGANPLVDEGRIVRDYQLKFKREVLVPTEFPFDITRFDGHIEPDGSLVLLYHSDEVNGFLRIIASPVVDDLDRYKGKYDVYHRLKDGTPVLYNPKFGLGYELRFQKDEMHYSLAIGNKKTLKRRFKAEDLIEVANGMVE